MRRFFQKLFASTPSSADAGPERQLESLRARLGGAMAGSPEAARLLNQVADLELQRGNREEALRCYGRCIDTHMELRQFDAAAAICRKLLRLMPDVVRARCTLAWLSIGKGLLDPARSYLDQYVASVQKADRREIAGQQIRLMAQCVRDPDFRSFLAEKLRELGDEEGATAVEGAASTDALPTPEEMGWDPVVFGALLTPEELEEARDKGLDLRTKDLQDDDFPIYGPSEGWG